jgi:hypothetical protein
MNTLFVVWPDPVVRRWIPVGQLTREDQIFRFSYTKGALKSQYFIPFGSMKDLNAIYESSDLFPLFANRILPKSRPEYRAYLRWLGLDAGNPDDLEILARSGGIRATDTLEIIHRSDRTNDNQYVVFFFAYGHRHLSRQDQERVLSLKSGEPLQLVRDVQNPADSTTLLLRTGEPFSVVGYAPRYYSVEFSMLLSVVSREQVRVTVEQVNPDAPSQFKLLCRLSSPWPEEFDPYSDDSFQPLVRVLA